MGLRRLRFHRLRPVWDLDIRCLLAAYLHSLYLLLVEAIPQGYPAREAPPPRVRSRSSVPPWAMMPESWARLYWRVNTSCTRKVA